MLEQPRKELLLDRAQTVHGLAEGITEGGEHVFSHYKNIESLTRCFKLSRKGATHKLGNPRMLRISFHTLRRWKAAMEYHKTKDIPYAMRLLGHKNIRNTLIYTQLVKPNEEENEYISKVARTVDDAKTLIEADFEYACEIEGVKLFREKKRFLRGLSQKSIIAPGEGFEPPFPVWGTGFHVVFEPFFTITSHLESGAFPG